MAVAALIMKMVTRAHPIARPAGQGDEEFLLRLYASTREDVLAWKCSEEERDSFFSMQHRMQEHYLRTSYPEAVCSVIQVEGKDAGRICVSHTAHEILILDIALLPEYRRRGIGSAVIADILEKAGEKRVPVMLMVDRFNRARSLYERMGFRILEDTGTHFVMGWTP